jgi:3-oxo-5alpha-steroid 4-dehydrogenase
MIVDQTHAYGWKDFRLNVAAQAESIVDLEQKLKLPDGSLVQTIDYYNRNAEHGKDPLFHKAQKYLAPLKKSPFTAYDLGVQSVFCPVHTFGGLQTSLHGEVINAWGEPIPGLYAAGRTSAGLPVAPYIGSGVSIGDSTFFGRRAGAHAAGHHI